MRRRAGPSGLKPKARRGYPAPVPTSGDDFTCAINKNGRMVSPPPRHSGWFAEVCRAIDAAALPPSFMVSGLVATQSMTVAGVAAALAYWSEIASEVDGDGEPHFETDLNSTVQFLEKMALAGKAIGGQA
jgi:hypothetical protein